MLRRPSYLVGNGRRAREVIDDAMRADDRNSAAEKFEFMSAIMGQNPRTGKGLR
ncbi:MAG: hypothetical protein IT474_04740 [Arenimonas sp.]|nr:hypothetical protein [Arenimonas sp.]